jgi:hypothetical protein
MDGIRFHFNKKMRTRKMQNVNQLNNVRRHFFTLFL